MTTKLFTRDFTLLWLGQAVSALGNGAGVIATMWWVQSTTGSAIALGMLALTKALVAVLFGPLAGVCVDRTDRKTIIVVTDLVRGCVYVFFAYCAYSGTLNFTIICVGSALSSACAQFFSPAVGATVPLLVPTERLQQANSVRRLTDQISSVFSYCLGGILLAWLGVPLLLLVDGCSFILSAVSETFIEIPPISCKPTLTMKSFMLDLKAGFAYVHADATLWRLLEVVVLTSFCFIPFVLLLPKLVEEQIGAGSDVFGYITAAQMLGMACGTLLILATNAPVKWPWLIRWGIGLPAIVFIITQIMPKRLWGLQLAVYAIFGFFNTIISISLFTSLQQRVSQQYLGKTLSLVNTMSAAAQPFANALSGYLADTIGLTAVFIGAGLLGIFSNYRFLAIPGVIHYLTTADKTVAEEAAN